MTGWKPSKKKKKSNLATTTLEEAPTPDHWSRRQSSVDFQLSSKKQLPPAVVTAAVDSSKLSPTPTPTPVGDKKFSFKQISEDFRMMMNAECV